MIISIASGKGGTGKTTIATNLAVVLANNNCDTAYLDCDVEEPNGRIFLKPEINEQIDVTVPVPRVDMSKCTLCGACSSACQFHAIVVLGKIVEVFEPLCHGCGGCSDICPENAITETPRKIGYINHGIGMGVNFYEGRLNVGEAISTPVTKALRKINHKSEITIIDAPPGTSCPVIEAVNDTDYVILVTEPTPFGLNDLILAVSMIRQLNLPFGVIINRCDIGNSETDNYCLQENIDVLARLPYNRKIAETYSGGNIYIGMDDDYEKILLEIFLKIKNRTHHDRISCR